MNTGAFGPCTLPVITSLTGWLLDGAFSLPHRASHACQTSSPLSDGPGTHTIMPIFMPTDKIRSSKVHFQSRGTQKREGL